MVTQSEQVTASNNYGLKEDLFEYHLPELFNSKWSPTTRAIVFLLGVIGLTASRRTQGKTKDSLIIIGIISLVRSLTNLKVTDVIGLVTNPSMRLRRSVRINAVVEDCYEFLSHFENYSRFMSYIEKVDVNEQGGLKWTAKGPGGILFKWNSTLKKLIKNQTIEWKSSSRSPIRNSGHIELIDLGNFETLIKIELLYAPPLGAVGYATVHLLGFDPKEKIDQDLQTLKTLIENQTNFKTRTSRNPDQNFMKHKI